MRSFSIRLTLTLWYGTILAIMLIAFSNVVYFSMRHQMLNRIDQGLREEMADVLSEVRRAETRSGMLDWLYRRFGQHQGFNFQITTNAGTRVFANERLGNEIIPVPSSLTMNRDTFSSSSRSEVPRWRVITHKVDGPGGQLIVQVARSLEYYDHEMGELLSVLSISGPATLLVALAGGYLLARRALSPVDVMQDAASRIGANRLDQRLNVANPKDELGRLATTLNGMLDRLEKSFREIQRFTADASHELRTPISVIRAEAEVALGKPIDEDEKQSLLSNILEECERLGWITEQLLTLSREDSGVAPLNEEAVDIDALVNDVVKTMRPLAATKHLELEVSSKVVAEVAGDADRLKQVVYNLLDNAIKYTKRAGRIEMIVLAMDGIVTMTVRDTGIGISPEHLPHVFERFYRVDRARTRSEGGTGLGLSIVESIVGSHSGNIRIESQEGEGTTVTISLPKYENADESQ